MRPAWWVPSLVLAVGCARADRPHPETAVTPTADFGSLVARVDGTPIYAAEIAAQAARTGATPRESLNELVAFHLLASRAAQQAPTNPAALAAAEKRALVQRLLERDLEPKLRPQDVPEAEVRTLYDRSKAFFVHPRLVEVVVLSVFTGPRMKPEPRERARATALALADLVAKRPLRTTEDFEAIANDPAWRDQRVKFTRTWQGPDGPFTAKVGQQVGQLRAPGDTTKLVEDEMGYHLVRYIAERGAKNVSFQEAQAELREGYHASWRQKAFAAFAAQLLARHGAEVVASGLLAAPTR